MTVETWLLLIEPPVLLALGLCLLLLPFSRKGAPWWPDKRVAGLWVLFPAMFHTGLWLWGTQLAFGWKVDGLSRAMSYLFDPVNGALLGLVSTLLLTRLLGSRLRAPALALVGVVFQVALLVSWWVVAAQTRWVILGMSS